MPCCKYANEQRYYHVTLRLVGTWSVDDTHTFTVEVPEEWRLVENLGMTTTDYMEIVSFQRISTVYPDQTQKFSVQVKVNAGWVSDPNALEQGDLVLIIEKGAPPNFVWDPDIDLVYDNS